MKYSKYLLIASMIIIGLMLFGAIALPILFLSLPLITLVILGFIWTADVTIHVKDTEK